MKVKQYAQITIYNGIGFDRMGGDKYTLAQWTLEGSIRAQVRESFDLDQMTIGERMYDDQGRYATDFEHDGAWRFRMELYVMKFTMVGAEWMEWKGIIDKLDAYTPEQEQAVWDAAIECATCKGKKKDGNGPHLIVDKYVPPTLSEHKGRYAVVRLGYRE